MGDCDAYDLDILTSLLDDDMALDETEANEKDNNVTQTSKGQGSIDPQQELRELEEKVAELRKQIQQQQMESLPIKQEVLLSTQGNGNLLKPQKIHKDIDLFDKCTQENPVRNFNKSKPKHAKDTEMLIHKGDTDSSDDEANRNPMECKYNEFGQFVRKRLAHQTKSYDTKENMKKLPWKRKSAKVNSLAAPGENNKSYKATTTVDQEKYETDPYSGIRIINPLVSFCEMRERMAGRKMVKMSTIRMHMRGGDIEGDWVTIGVLVNKSEPKKSSKGNTFSIWKLCDLRDCNKLVTLFLFGKTHETHWKTVVGSVIGILNASFMPDKDSMQTKGNTSELCLTVDNPQKILLMGTSKDFGLCRGRRKDGALCTMLVNKADCEFCHYHIQKEYRKSSAKRMDLQASYSGPEPSGLRAKILQKQQVMYGGQIYISPRLSKTPTSAPKSKDRLTLDNLKLQKKVSEIAKTERAAIVASHLSNEETEVVNNINDHCESLAKMLTLPTAGSRNLLKHMTKPLGTESEASKVTANSSPSVLMKSITPVQLLKLHEIEMNAKRAQGQLRDAGQVAKTVNDDLICVPKLAKGLKHGDSVDLEFGIKNNGVDKAKAKAIYQIQAKGPLQKMDPNEIKKNRSSPEFQEKVKKRLAVEVDDSDPTSADIKKPRLEIDVASETFQKLLNKKSKYENLLEEENVKLEGKYFDELEKKERLEDKMVSTMAVPCKAVSCKKCKYTALAALDSCRTEGHPLVVHKAVKRFFKCKDCSRRTISLSKLPTKPCSGCGGKNYERVAMWKERTGPKLGGENLSIRGIEVKNLNSLSSGNINLNV